ncbi:uncharacterized protein LOC123671624 [Harmonia axyridis]|uniref:uncharacterized protein LOC123671624 n=1 Tax=Harmonia axyridis TaxID=115357 RepID=UPI001E277379|nr:uncharacterized protein LOC123671624 [Harmonia axyridis]
MPNILPHDPRTLLKTYHTIVMVKIGENGHYWHHGLQFSLQKMLTSIQNLPKKISLNISMDGLPIYKSSRSEFWPILFNIHELPEIKPMIIGIYCGKGKPSNLAEYLTPFVEEAKPILSEGLIINGNNTTVKIRCFVCDSPARAFIKGVTNFNSKHGCLKCTTVGEYSHISHTVYFPTIVCEKRTNAGFHAKLYGSHHKQDTPLSLLPIDMVEDFPVSDSLHLIDLGVMKRCLLGWRDGSFGTYKTKWCAKDITDVSHFLEKCKLPSEVHRAVRGLNVLCHWKGSEYHTFLHYLSIVILKDVLPLDVYQHFLNFFCAITICSTKYYVHFLHLAEALLNNYVEYYRDFYGEDYITSNVHNLTHLVDEVRRYGPLTTFNAYPFESRLYQIKNLLRNGNSPLAQVAKRMSEIIQCENESKKYCTSFPVLKSKNDSGFFSKIELKQFSLSADNRNKWFLTHNDDIVAMEYAILINNTPLICGHAVGDNLQEVFEIPIKSSFLNIFKTNNNNQKPLKLYSTTDVKCKMVATKYRDEFFFIPLLHTLHENK